MKNQVSTSHTEDKTISVQSEKKSWHAPEITELNVQDTKGGRFDINWEDPWSCIFSS